MQARQAFVFATAGHDGGRADWIDLARCGLQWLLAHARRPDGLYMTRLDLAGAPELDHAQLYEQAFVLLALAALAEADAGDPLWRRTGEALWRAVDVFALPDGGYVEWGDHPRQANAQMHLLEAALAWDRLGEGPWSRVADGVVALACSRFIAPQSGRLSEYFDTDWRPLTRDAGLVEPGHHFEWAWLLTRWSRSRERGEVGETARRLYAAGRRGWDPGRRVAVNALWEDGAVRDGGARLWPQTEHVKAALILGETNAALAALNGLRDYLETPTPGVWRERMQADGRFRVEPSPATSLYHLFLAVRELARPS